MNFEQSDERIFIEYVDTNQKLVGVLFLVIGVLGLIPTLFIGGGFMPMLFGSLLCMSFGIFAFASTLRIISEVTASSRTASIEKSSRVRFLNASWQIGFSDIKQIELASFLYSNLRKGMVLYLITKTGNKVKLAGWKNYTSPFDRTEISEDYFVGCGQSLASFLNVPFENDPSKWHALDS